MWHGHLCLHQKVPLGGVGDDRGMKSFSLIKQNLIFLFEDCIVVGRP